MPQPAGGARDGGALPSYLAPGARDGCSCRLGGGADSPSPLALALVAALALAAGRRFRANGRVHSKSHSRF